MVELKCSKTTKKQLYGELNRRTDVYLINGTEFENGKATERFTYFFIGDKVSLEGYTIK